MAITYNDLFLDIRRELKRGGVIDTTLEARELVCFAAGKDRAALLRDGSLYASPETEEAAWALARRRLAGEPVAYLIGEWEFYGLPLDISESVLIPRPDTETLAEAAIGWLRQQEAPRVLDLCAGSGCLGLAIASQVKDARVVLGELSDGALRICRQNIRRNGLEDIVTAKQANVFDLLTDLADHKCHDYDFIILDPPAFTKSGHTVHNAIRGYKEINLKAMKLLPRGGYLATCSCSHFMRDDLFRRMLHDAAKDAGVRLRQIEGRQQSPDHPILWNVPETNYLKFYLFQVV